MVFSMNHQPVTPKTSPSGAASSGGHGISGPDPRPALLRPRASSPGGRIVLSGRNMGWKTHETTSRNGWKAPTKTSEMDGKIWKT